MNRVLIIMGVLLIAAGIPVAFIDDSKGSEVPLLAGLFILLTAQGKHEDERERLLKASSAYIAVIAGYVIKLLGSNLYSHGLLPVELVDVNHFLILVCSLALLIYYVRLYFILR